MQSAGLTPVPDNFAIDIGPAPAAATGAVAGAGPQRGYWQRTFSHVVMGDYAEDDATLASLGIGLAAGFTGLDVAMDIRDLSHSLATWQWSWGHVGKTALNAVGVIPVVGMIKYLKYLDNVADVGKHYDEAAEAVGRGVSQFDVVGDTRIVSQVDTLSVAPRAAHNAAQFERYKDALRAGMQKPHATNPQLAKYLDELYRPGAKIGSGSTAAAVREELAKGVSVGGRTHSQKAADYIRALQKWLRENPTTRPGDRAAAENVIRDMQNALNGN
ncbi:MAG: hypothetical protein GXY83_10620 [Rhodopirellula sp.]|nr:hypothetical protein [Rhodopirellula sp.]